MVKPNVPDLKQVNLYQKGFTSRMPPELRQVGEGKGCPSHKGTVACVNTLVPQTGKALDGFCPGPSQPACAHEEPNDNNNIKSSKAFFMSKKSFGCFSAGKILIESRKRNLKFTGEPLFSIALDKKNCQYAAWGNKNKMNLAKYYYEAFLASHTCTPGSPCNRFHRS